MDVNVIQVSSTCSTLQSLDPFIIDQIEQQDHSFATGAFHLMFISAAGRRKRARAHDTRVRAHGIVHGHVAAQCRARAEHVTAMLTLVRLDLLV